MNTDALFKVLSAIHPISEDFKASLKEELIPLSLPKNYLLLEAPRIAEFVYFIENGFAMSYTFQEGKKLTEAFWKSGQIMTSANSFFEQVLSMEYIQLVEKSELLCVSRAGVQRLFDQHREAHFLYHKIMNKHYVHCRARIHDIQLLSASQRFETLLKLFPDIEQAITQESIASYLSITPQSLSRLKRERKNS